MKKSIVDSYQGKMVKVLLCDGWQYTGIFEKGTGYETGLYHCAKEVNGNDNDYFRSSHIKKITEIDDIGTNPLERLGNEELKWENWEKWKVIKKEVCKNARPLRNN